MRLDNSSQYVRLRVFHETGREEFVFDDPCPPVDICLECFEQYGFSPENEIERPPYDDLEYNCVFCGKRLTEDEED